VRKAVQAVVVLLMLAVAGGLLLAFAAKGRAVLRSRSTALQTNG
jgi:hypothetical protein